MGHRAASRPTVDDVEEWLRHLPEPRPLTTDQALAEVLALADAERRVLAAVASWRPWYQPAGFTSTHPAVTALTELIEAQDALAALVAGAR